MGESCARNICFFAHNERVSGSRINTLLPAVHLLQQLLPRALLLKTAATNMPSVRHLS
jgi:hypothetical protein